MRYPQINNQLFIENRKKLIERMKPKSIAVILSNDILPTNADGTLRFKQNSNLFYLTGVEQEETILLMAPDFPDKELREILFLSKTTDLLAIWEGEKLSNKEGSALSGVKRIESTNAFDRILNTMMVACDTIYLDTNEHIRNTSKVESRSQRFIKKCQQQFPLHHYERLAPILKDLRCVKSSLEIDLIQAACNITEQGFRKALKFIKPRVYEYEIEALYLHEFVSRRSRGFAYEPIIGGGKNTCVLHYLKNSDLLKDGDLVLMDVGAEYANYCADMTRTLPVNGRFSDRQKQVYNAVLRVKNAATTLLRPGNNISEYHEEVGKLMETELLKLGLINKTDIKNQLPEQPAYKKYFMHGTSHHLGLDVHDVASVYKAFEPGMVLTVEPGIYIPKDKIGIRLEDNVLITKDEPINLMKNIPIETEEIEGLMN